MSELLPIVQAENIRRGLVDYLTTTFALTDREAQDGLDRFLSDPETGMFKGPYVRLRLPFRPATEGWRESLDWYEGFTPYGHQAATFERLASICGGHDRRPLPTVVTTGTGSGKTEAFLYPILDHVLRARKRGITGTKALILYPMNALANDQAGRLAVMITGHPELEAVTAALYTGQTGPPRTTVTADGLITDRAIIRDTAPDILLTNYKMLDQLLLRSDDQALWRQSATSLQYLVLDEFHTYDGAQGTDVAMLLRRLGLALKSHWAPDDTRLTDDDRARPLGRITPVGTSATLGDKDDPQAMLEFAETVFGEPFDEESVITESRLGVAEWVGDAEARVAARGLRAVPVPDVDADTINESVAALGEDPAGEDVARTLFGQLYDGPVGQADADADLLLDLAKAHPLVQSLAGVAADAQTIDALLDRLGLATSTTSAKSAAWAELLAHLIAALGHVRAVTGRDGPTVEVHLWVRELTRIDRAADAAVEFRWSDDGPPAATEDAEVIRPSFPAVFCRHCGRSGWGIGMAPVGDNLAANDEAIRRNHLAREGRFRTLVFAPGEAEAASQGEEVVGLSWLSVRNRTLLPSPPEEDDPELLDGWILPVLTTVGDDADDAAATDTCPACGQPDGIRFLGSAIATLLSVALSTLLGSPTLAAREKKALVFTDSVQDAAHRAGFVQARSHVLTLRGVFRMGVEQGALTLDDLVDEILRQAGDDDFARYRLLAPDCADRESFRPFWQATTLRSVPTSVRSRVRRRLALDAMLEFGLSSRTGRTLELTGAAAVEVDAGQPAKMIKAARAALDGYAFQPQLDRFAVQPDLDGVVPQPALDASSGDPEDAALVQWVRGVLDRMRAQGAIDHPWFERYRREDGRRWSIWGGRPRSEGMPAFPAGRPAPAYPRIGGGHAGRGDSGLDLVTSRQSWYATWTAQVLSVPRADGAMLCRLLIERLGRDGVLTTTSSESGATVFAIPASGVVVHPTTTADLAAGRHLLECDSCHATTPGSLTTIAQLAGAPCLVVRCRGRLQRAPLHDSFYRRLYGSADMRRVVAREHTSLLDDATRLAYETGFKSAGTDPAAPNVLVATPTLEMGIDIGDLSSVFLASLPRTVASYLQRVGRAGRLTGNALDLAFVTGRGEQLPKLGEPLSVINGEVRPPATYLRAEEILRRQYVAHLVDEFARDVARPHPNTAVGAIGSTNPNTFLGDLIARAESHVPDHLTRFVGAFDGLGPTVTDGLATWLRPGAEPGSSDFARTVHDASRRWQLTVETLRHRLDRIDAVLPELIDKEQSPAATDDDRRALRSAQATRRLTTGQLSGLRGEHWISVLEQYGLLPNYTLLDDTVVLDVGLSWTDPDTNTFQTEHAQFQRGSAQAIREFAPGATFYARGWEIVIDAIDLGLDGESIRPWAFCADCGFAADVALDGQPVVISSCPRCGSTGIADRGQRLDVVELTHVSAEVRRDEASISDRSDERTSRRFELVAAADIDPAHIDRRWFVEDIGLGCTYLTCVDVRWTNLGTSGHGAGRLLSGAEHAGSLFRVCRGCGKLDVEAGHNRAHEHRPWCRYRTAVDEQTVQVALTRTLRTQGLLVRLPYSVTIGDPFAVPSLSAALLLGLREQVGGHPDHIRIEQAVDPTPTSGTDNHEALLLHDVVPGGTGYLAELAEPDQLHELLTLAWRRVRDCECRHEDRQACHRCLLPFVPSASVRRVSRASAERHLRTLLGLSVDATDTDFEDWTITENPPAESYESHLEQRFRQTILRRLDVAGATITQVPGVWGNTARFTLPGQRREWTLTPQQHVENSKPDFLLESTDTNVPTVAIFTDGRAYHAVPAHNRLADDASKREILRGTGRIVLGISAVDLQQEETGTVNPPAWFSEQILGQVLQQAPFMARPAAYATLKSGPIDWLMSWVSSPDRDSLAKVARAVPMFLLSGADQVQAPAAVSLDRVGRSVLLGEELGAADDTRPVVVRRFGRLVVAIAVGNSVEVALVLDDRDEVLDEQHAGAWREWLRLSNSLALRDWPTTITTVQLVGESGHRKPTVVTGSPTSAELPGNWLAAVDLAAVGAERDLVAALAGSPGLAPPEIGFEGPGGIPLDLAWPDARIAVDVTALTETDVEELGRAGWHVLPPEVDTIIHTLTRAGVGPTA